jgi:hypothetical protein
MADIRINALATTATSAASDDYLALDGSANGTRKILATNVAQNVTDVTFGASGPSAKSSINARAARQGLVFDGASYASVANIPALGTGDWTFSAWIKHTGSGELNVVGSGDATGVARLGINVNSNGQLVFNDGLDVSLSSSTGFVPYDKNVLLTVRRSGATIYASVNGAGEITLGSAGVLNITATAVLIGRWSSNFPLYWSGTISSPLIYNRALSAAEVVSLFEAGVPSAADYNSASNTALSLGTITNVSYTSFSGASATGFTGVQASSDAFAKFPTAVALRPGQFFRVTGTLTLNNGKTVIPSVLFATGTDQVSLGAAGAFSITFGTTAGSSSDYIYFRTTGDADFTLSNLAVTRIGLLLAPDAGQAGNGYVWNDQSGNLAQIVLPSSGVAWNLPSITGNRIRGTTSTNGNQQLLGASVLLPAECQITHVRARARSGTPTITIGTASGGAQIVSSVALSTTWLNCTIALTGGIVSSADDIWVGSDSTDVVEIDIAFQPLDF